jgi:hypothetical protein
MKTAAAFGRRRCHGRPASERCRAPIFLLRSSEIAGMMPALLAGIFMSTAVYTANVLTSARAAAGMTSRARRPLYGHSAG